MITRGHPGQQTLTVTFSRLTERTDVMYGYPKVSGSSGSGLIEIGRGYGEGDEKR